MAYRDRQANPHSIALDNYSSMNEKVDSLIEPVVPLSIPAVSDITSLIVIMIRLPFTITKVEGVWTVSWPEYLGALAGLPTLTCPTKWVGLLDMHVDSSEQEAVSACLKEVSAYPVFLDAQTLEDGVVRFAKSVQFT